MPIGRSAFQHANGDARVLGQAAGQHRTRGAAADDHIIEHIRHARFPHRARCLLDGRFHSMLGSQTNPSQRGPRMEYVCDAPHNRTWFRLVTEGEAVAESLEMRHAVEKHYRRERERAADAFHPTTSVFIEQDINKEAHIRRAMPQFLTLARRGRQGAGHRDAAAEGQGRRRLHHRRPRQRRSLSRTRRRHRRPGGSFRHHPRPEQLLPVSSVTSAGGSSHGHHAGESSPPTAATP